MRIKPTKLHYPAIVFAVCLIIALGLRVFVFNGDNISDSKTRYKVEAELEPYLESFVSLARLKGIDLSYIYNNNITIKWMSDAMAGRGTNVATAFGRNKAMVVVFVNKKRFYERTEEGRKYVMFHEFGHDILDFTHLERPNRGMMEPTAYTGFFKNYDRFTKEIQEDYLYKSLNKMFERYIVKQNGDNISDEEWKTTISNSAGFTKVTLTNKTTYEFYSFIGAEGEVLIGTFKGEVASAYLFADAFVIRDYINNNILLVIQLN